MEQIIKEEKKISKKLIVFLSLSLLAVFVIIAILIFSLKSPELKKAKSDFGSSSSPAYEEGVLGSLNPFAEDADVSQEISPVDTTTGGSSSGGSGGGGGGGSSGSSEQVISIENKSFKGSLEMDNIINRNYTSSNLGLAHYPGAIESLDNYDSRYYAMFDPSGIASKIISKNSDYELDADIRPINSMNEYYIELSVVSQSKGDITINSANELRISLPLQGYDFGEKVLTLQQYNPENTIETYPQYNLKNSIQEGNGVFILTLNNLSGTYKSEVPYAYFKISFS